MEKKSCFSFTLTLLLLLTFSSCRTTREEEKVHLSTIQYDHSLRVDSIYVGDSIYLKESADTVYLSRTRTLYRDRWRIDTLLKCDTLYIERLLTSTSSSSSPSRGRARRWFLAASLFFFGYFVYKSGLWNRIKRIV